jgi:AAA15 family ATPase/GTPase
MSIPVGEIEKIEMSEDKKSELLLDSLEIKGYRCFEHLTIEKLGRVNLIVGKNNVGKTNLLEALWIYSHQGSLSSVLDVLRSRDEIQVIRDDYSYSDEISKESINNIGNLFYQRPNIHSTVVSEATIETSKKELSIKVGWYVNTTDSDLEISNNPNSSNAEIYFVPYFYSSEQDSETQAIGIALEEIRKLDEPFKFSPKSKSLLPTSYFVRYDGISSLQASRLWDNISLTDFEEEVIRALQIITPDIKKLGFLSPSRSNSLRVAMGRMRNQVEAIPLRAFGEGMNRLLGIALALVNCRNGILLIDEIESGLHYSVLPEVWKLIFKTAKDLNVQVFATTYSYDCIQAFAEAAIKDKESEGNLIRLASRDDQIKAFTFDEKQLETITKDKIEVR